MVREAAKAVAQGFEGAPALLLILVLNVAGMLSAGYYLLQSDRLSNERAHEISELLRLCINDRLDLSDVHDRTSR